MKILKLILPASLILSLIISDYGKLPTDKKSPLSKANKNTSEQNKDLKKIKSKNINKPKNLNKDKFQNQDLKDELVSLEKEFKIKKAELRSEYKQKRKNIYAKYGVKPPKRQNDEHDKKAFKLKESSN